DIECDIVKVPHHGSKYSSGSALLEDTTPLLSIICVGAKNRFGHPADRVLEDYERAGSAILRTDRDGAIFVTLGREDFTYTSHSGDTGHFSSTIQPIPQLIE
ncbi:MAG: ComEC/Rec2 family competence protein, partial [bacterium]